MTPIEITERARRLQRQAEEDRVALLREEARLRAMFIVPHVVYPDPPQTAVEVRLRIEDHRLRADAAVQNWLAEVAERLVRHLRKAHPEWSWYTGAPTLDEYLRRVRWRRLEVERWELAGEVNTTRRMREDRAIINAIHDDFVRCLLAPDT